MLSVSSKLFPKCLRKKAEIKTISWHWQLTKLTTIIEKTKKDNMKDAKMRSSLKCMIQIIRLRIEWLADAVCVMLNLDLP